MNYRHALISMTSKLPVSLQKIPYFLGLKLSQFYLKSGLTIVDSIWARHSYNQSYFIAGLSDLDLTINLNQEPTISEKTLLIHKLSTLKKIIPFLGEINIYTPEIMKNLKDFSNFFEIQRDRKTIERFYIENNSTKKNVQALVFILKAISANRKSLIKNTSIRIPKWKYYLSLTGEKVQNLSEKNCLSVIETNIDQLLKKININHFNYGSFLRGNLDPHQRFIFSPSQWITETTYQGTFDEYYKSEIGQLTENEAMILLYQFRWDVFGIATQVHHYPPQQIREMINFITRLQLIGKKIQERFLNNEFNELNQKINFLISYLTPYCQGV